MLYSVHCTSYQGYAVQCTSYQCNDIQCTVYQGNAIQCTLYSVSTMYQGERSMCSASSSAHFILSDENLIYFNFRWKISIQIFSIFLKLAFVHFYRFRIFFFIIELHSTHSFRRFLHWLCNLIVFMPKVFSLKYIMNVLL